MSFKIEEYSACPSCNTDFLGDFCHNCGEQKIKKDQLKLRHYFEKVWNALTFTDVKFVRSIKYLLFSPGRLTKEYFKGKRKLYAAPLAMFFAINLIYFIYQPVDALNSTYESQTRGQSYSDWAQKKADQKMKDLDLSVEDFATQYNATTEDVSKLFLILFVLIFAVGVYAVNVGHSRLFTVHLITATHYVSFTILSVLLIIPFIVHMGILGYLFISQDQSFNFNPNSQLFLYPLLVLFLVYTYAMQRNIYRQNILVTSIKTVLLITAFVFSVLLYRLFLFVVTLWLL